MDKVVVIDEENKQKIEYYPNSRIRKVTHKYSGGESWEDSLLKIMLEHLKEKKIIE